MIEYPGRAERETAHALLDTVPDACLRTLRPRDVDLAPALEHAWYLALRSGSLATPQRRPSAARVAARLAYALARACRGDRHEADVVAVVTQPVHVALFDRVRAHLPAGMGVRVVDGRTGTDAASRLPGIDCRLIEHFEVGSVARLLPHAIASSRAWRRPPAAWRELVDATTAARLTALAANALPILALDAARVEALIRRHRPRVVACFSEVGRLARLVPSVGNALRVPVVDLPHAEAADPWGSVGMPYHALAVYGPRARDVLRMAGIQPERIEIIGPLAADELIALASRTDPDPAARRVLFASQPADPQRPALHPDVKRGALRAALALARGLGAAEVVIVPHPTETDTVTNEFLAATPGPAGTTVRSEPSLRLHDLLPETWVMVTASSQSVFESVLAGVPAVTVNVSGGPDPVSFAREGLAIGITSVDEGEALGRRLADPDERTRAAAAARMALGDRLGPLDGGAASRAARWLAGLAVDGIAVAEARGR